MILRNEDKGQEVSGLQKQLRKHGQSIAVDAIYGPATERAVRNFQRSVGLVVDGIAGPKTMRALSEQKKDPKVLSEDDLRAAAEQTGLPLPTVKAINYVESRGEGFLKSGKPKILYERHIMYRLLQKGYKSGGHHERNNPKIVNSKPGGYLGGEAEYSRLVEAKRIEPDCAMESCSWGLGQVMGFHWKRLGYESVQDMVNQMYESEGSQLDAMFRFIMADDNLYQAALRKDWATFAHGYNGPAYRKNEYDTRLERAEERFSED